MATKITKLTRDQVAALREMAAADRLRGVELTATTATFTLGTAGDAASAVAHIREEYRLAGESRHFVPRSLAAVVRKLDRANEVEVEAAKGHAASGAMCVANGTDRETALYCHLAHHEDEGTESNAAAFLAGYDAAAAELAEQRAAAIEAATAANDAEVFAALDRAEDGGYSWDGAPDAEEVAPGSDYDTVAPEQHTVFTVGDRVELRGTGHGTGPGTVSEVLPHDTGHISVDLDAGYPVVSVTVSDVRFLPPVERFEAAGVASALAAAPVGTRVTVHGDGQFSAPVRVSTGKPVECVCEHAGHTCASPVCRSRAGDPTLPRHRRLDGCRYCTRYGYACGREHTEDTRADWSRTWDGRPAATPERVATAVCPHGVVTGVGPDRREAEELAVRGTEGPVEGKDAPASAAAKESSGQGQGSPA